MQITKILSNSKLDKVLGYIWLIQNTVLQLTVTLVPFNGSMSDKVDNWREREREGDHKIKSLSTHWKFNIKFQNVLHLQA